MSRYYFYLLKYSTSYLYAGITSNLRKRIIEHRNGECPVTKNRGNIIAVYYERYPSREEAAKREKEVKGWRRSKKEKLFKKISLHRGTHSSFNMTQGKQSKL